MVAFVNRRVLALVGLVLVSVAAISMYAATLTTATGLEAGPDAGPLVPTNISGQGPGGAPEPGGGDVLRGNSTKNGTVVQLAGCNDLLSSVPGTLLYFGALVGVLYLLKRRFSLGLTIFGGYALVPVALAVYFLRTDCVAAGGPGTGNGTSIRDTIAGETPAPEVPPEIMLGVFAVLFIGVAVAVFLSSGEGEYADGDEDEEEDIAGTDVEDIAAAAANAAERLEERNADVDNEVYRAWWEMTQLLDIDSPETYTPGQFAEAAIEVGIDEEHVNPLTTLFEEVRYGHEDAGAREDRAIEIFRAIETEYGSTEETTGDQATDTADTEDDQ